MAVSKNSFVRKSQTPMLFRIVLIINILAISFSAFSQELTQNIKGQILDKDSQQPIEFATVTIEETEFGTLSDTSGNFILQNIPVGRYNIKISCIGYEPIIIPEVTVSSTKETNLNVKLQESITTLDEILIKPTIQKNLSLNNMATVSARMLSVEEASRYAGGFDDPARLAASFAGVASNISNNAIVIRGNAPKFLQWRMEGVEIPNPNHFADLNAFGGGGLTALSSNLLANSDFFTGAFPAEYNNALSGVFDIQMRSGNNSEYEHSFQVGLLGIDFSSEGPLSKKQNSSYIFNYRYSSLGLLASILPDDASGTTYQDLAFKFNFVTKKAGTFSFWGIGLIDKSGTNPETDTTLWDYYQDKEEGLAKQYMGAAGLNHRILINTSAFLNTSLVFSGNGLDLYTKRLDSNLVLTPENRIKSFTQNITFRTYLNKKFSPKHTIRTGFTAKGLNYQLELQDNILGGENLSTIVSETGFTTLLSAFYNSNIRTEKFTFNLGINTQLFTLNSNYTIEPRLGISFKINQNNQLSFAYGLHSRLERLNIYFIKDPQTSEDVNKNLDFSKAHHFVLGYDKNLGEHTHLKIEAYYQQLFNIPIIENSTYSLINLENDWFLDNKFVNKGLGKNYGIDITLEQYINKGFYYLISASVFDSKYKTDLDDWYDTRFNRTFLLNALAGKEFELGAEKQKILGINLKISWQGGDRYSPVDSSTSILAKEVIYDETKPFTKQLQSAFTAHITINYKWNRKKTSHELALKVINATAYSDYFGHRLNLKTQKIEELREVVILPNLSYKVSF